MSVIFQQVVYSSFLCPFFLPRSAKQTPDHFRFGRVLGQQGQTAHRLAQPQVNLFICISTKKPKTHGASTCLLLNQNNKKKSNLTVVGRSCTQH